MTSKKCINRCYLAVSLISTAGMIDDPIRSIQGRLVETSDRPRQWQYASRSNTCLDSAGFLSNRQTIGVLRSFGDADTYSRSC